MAKPVVRATRSREAARARVRSRPGGGAVTIDMRSIAEPELCTGLKRAGLVTRDGGEKGSKKYGDTKARQARPSARRREPEPRPGR
jgi:ribosomal protein S9